MPENLGSYKVFSEGGLNTNRDILSQQERQPGSAIKLTNYEPSVTGGYRKISGFLNDFGTVPGTGSVLGVAVVNGINDGILAARAPSSGNNYLHRWVNSSSSWTAVTSAGSPTMSGVTKVRFTPYEIAGSAKVILTDGVNPAAIYDGSSYVQITHAQAPDDPKFATAFQNHMWLAGDPNEVNNLYFSEPSKETDYDPALGAGFFNVGFPIVAIKPFRDNLFVFGTNNIKKLTGNNKGNFTLETVTNNLGCMASDSVIEIGGDLLFLSQDGLRPVSGTDRIGDVNLETVSKNIQSIFTDVIFDIDLEGLSAAVIRTKTQFRYYFAGADTQGIIGGFRESPTGGMQFEYSQMLGITATCAASGYIGQNEFVIHGASDGKVHRQERGNSFGGEDIFSVYQTPYYYMQDPEQRKIFYTIATYMRSEGDNEIAMSAVYDYEDINSLNPTDFSIDNEGAAAYYNEATFDAGAIYDGSPSPVRRTNISGSGKAISLRYVTNDTKASHAIQGIVITYGVGDRL